ncbi:MAG: hypothetical protein JRH15_18630 [Deltaproteobacteria bacterium]|nr:hypothetical protein [Deltaproteobacteria bacterium]
MTSVSNRNLKILSALVWYIGGVVLMLKGFGLSREADVLKPGHSWPLLAFLSGLLIGGLKAKFLFSKSCKKNLTRIDALAKPKIWQFFRLRFLVFLVLMIITGVTLSRLAHNHYPLLIGMSILDFSIAVGLIGSGYVFWKH